MTEIMLRDAGRAHGLAHVILRYFNVAGADPHSRTGQSSTAATHLIKVAAETALGLRPKLEVFGTDYPTPDGTCIRDYIHVSDLVRAHSDALRHLRSGAPSLTLNCGYGHGFSVLEVIDTVKRVSGADFKVEMAPRREGDPARIVAASDKSARDARLAAAVRRSFHHRRPRARLGTRTRDAPLERPAAIAPGRAETPQPGHARRRRPSAGGAPKRKSIDNGARNHLKTRRRRGQGTRRGAAAAMRPTRTQGSRMKAVTGRFRGRLFDVHPGAPASGR